MSHLNDVIGGQYRYRFSEEKALTREKNVCVPFCFLWAVLAAVTVREIKYLVFSRRISSGVYGLGYINPECIGHASRCW